jgi:hypothetical protein
MKLVAWATGIIAVITASTCVAANTCKPIHLSVLNLSGKAVRIISANNKVTTISARKGSVNDASKALQPQRAQLDSLCGRFTLMIGDVTREIYVLSYKHMPQGHIAAVRIEAGDGSHYQVTGTRDVIPNLQAFKDWYSMRPLVKQTA